MRRILIILSLILIGCTPARFRGYTPDKEWAEVMESWGCSYEEVARERDRALKEAKRVAEAQGIDTYRWNPEVGMSICQMFGWVGMPTGSAGRTSSAYGRSVTRFTYVHPSPGLTFSVVLERFSQEGWVVTNVATY